MSKGDRVCGMLKELSFNCGRRGHFSKSITHLAWRTLSSPKAGQEHTHHHFEVANCD